MADKMYKTGDKHGDGKFSYKQQYANVSVAVYKELVLEDSQKAMTPYVCYEFCRSIDGMGFFGITEGRTCYCTPYYVPDETGTGSCDLPCPGDSLQMCGGKSKSSLYEMHYCGGKGAALTAVSAAAGEALSAFYAAALYASRLSSQLQKSG